MFQTNHHPFLDLILGHVELFRTLLPKKTFIYSINIHILCLKTIQIVSFVLYPTKYVVLYVNLIHYISRYYLLLIISTLFTKQPCCSGKFLHT